MVVSDHGFSTIARGSDIVGALRNAKINAFSKMDNPERGDIMVVGLGGSTIMYAIDHDEATIRKTVATLQQCDFTGVIFSRVNIEGTFPLDAVRYNQTNGPDIVLSMKWFPEKSDDGAPGLIISSGAGGKGGGTHGSLSPFDMNNTLVARGPDFQQGVISDVPSGNVDVAPTILDILGVAPQTPMEGRPLREAYANGAAAKPEVKETKLEATRKIGFLRWNQYLKVSQIGDTVYFDEGNGDLRLE
jgi:arylsulfatase A-like enzyme